MGTLLLDFGTAANHLGKLKDFLSWEHGGKIPSVDPSSQSMSYKVVHGVSELLEMTNEVWHKPSVAKRGAEYTSGEIISGVMSLADGVSKLRKSFNQGKTVGVGTMYGLKVTFSQRPLVWESKTYLFIIFLGGGGGGP